MTSGIYDNCTNERLREIRDERQKAEKDLEAQWEAASKEDKERQQILMDITWAEMGIAQHTKNLASIRK